MKRVVCALVPALVLFAAAGCDVTNLPSDAKAILTAQGVNAATGGDQLQTQQRERLMDGSCTGDGNQYQYQNQSGGAGLNNGANGAAGQCAGDCLRLRGGI